MKYFMPLLLLNVFAWWFGDMLPSYIQVPLAVILLVGAVVAMVVGVCRNEGQPPYLSQEIARKPQQRQIERNNGAKPLSAMYFVNIDNEELLVSGNDLKKVLIAMADVKIQFRQQSRATRYTIIDGRKQLEERR